MKVLFIDWDCFGKLDMIDAMQHRNIEVISFPFDKNHPHHDVQTEANLLSALKRHTPDFVFSFNFFPIISKICQKSGIKYVSWVYDSPYVLLYSCTLINPCNIVFLFDKEQYREFQEAGIPTVRYLPLAANPERLRKREPLPYRHEVTFIGSLYTESHTFYDRMKNLPAQTQGYLEGLMSAQEQIYGYNLIQETLPEAVIRDMHTALPMEPNPDGVETLRYLYSEYVINRKITQTERQKLLRQCADAGVTETISLFTPEASFSYPGIANLGTVDYWTEMAEVFQTSRINLNLTLRSIHSGIPLRCFDIIGSGGFLLSNYQNDFTDCFTPGEDVILFDSPGQLPEYLRYYLQHEEERKQIADHGFNTLCKRHTYHHRLDEILSTIG